MDKFYNIHFDEDGYASLYEVSDENYWTYEEAMRIVRMENKKKESENAGN